ncbi:MAG: antitoxin family protein [Planctomycetes bacterium]|nr:antitoxin family protein [Planctomycetota bacterium]
MSLEVEATYENGVLKLDRPLPLKENERLTIRIIPKTSRVQESYGRLRWTGDPEILRKIAEDPEFSALES